VPDDDDPEFLTTAEAARLLGMSVRTVVRWTNEGRLPSVVIDGEKRLSRRHLQALRKCPEEGD
jgi:excisionase family DNA binding protein